MPNADPAAASLASRKDCQKFNQNCLHHAVVLACRSRARPDGPCQGCGEARGAAGVKRRAPSSQVGVQEGLQRALREHGRVQALQLKAELRVRDLLRLQCTGHRSVPNRSAMLVGISWHPA